MKYESNILKRLIDTYGVVGNPRYISEIIKEFIVQGKERFPNLFTYQADWLAHIDEFGLNPSYTVSYTGQSIYAPNTLERPVKSAILTGNTLVNLIDNGSERKEITYSISTKANYQINKDMLVANKTYLLLFTVTDFSGDAFYASFNKSDQYGITRLTDIGNGLFKAKVNFSDLTSVTDTLIIYKNTGSTLGGYTEKVMLIPYQDGMENWDIPYFEGMQSVKLPVLTTTGKNMFDIDNVIQQEGVIIKDNSIHITENRDYPDNVIYTFENAPTESVLTFDLSSNDVQASDGALASIWYEDGTNIWITTTKKVYVNTKKITEIKIHNWCKGTHILSNIQLEEGSTATSYEPFKSNILTVNEEVELGGIGEVKDELNLMTGEITSYSYNYTITGNESWSDWTNDLGEYVTFYFYYKNSNMPNIPNEKVGKGICNKFKVVTNVYNTQQRAIGIGREYLSLGIKFSELNITSDSTRSERVNALKTWLKNNNVEIRLPYAQEVVKTVDLNILDQNGQNVKQLMSFNGGTHFITGSAEGSPLPVLSVSVETDLEETLKVCSLEGNTM